MKVVFAVLGLVLFVIISLSLVAFWFFQKIQNVGKEEVPTLKDGSKLRRMGLLSEIWHHLYLSNQSPNIHSAVYGFDPAKKSQIEFWEEVCRQCPNFRSVPLKQNGLWYWKELNLSKIDIKKHLTEIELDWTKEEKKSDDKEESVNADADRHVQKIAAFITEKQLSRPFDKERPHWEAIYVKLKGTDNRVFGYLRCHHAMGDGVILMKSIFEVYEKLWPGEDNKMFGFSKKIIESGRKADIGMDLEKEATKKRDRASVLTTIDLKEKTRGAADVSLADIWREGPQILRDFYEVLYKESPIPSKSVYRHGEMKREYELSVSKTMNMGNLKILCHHFSCTINDLMTTLWLNSMSKYLFKNASKSELAKWKQLYGDTIDLRFITIFNLRKATNKGNDSNAEENHVAMLPVKLPFGDMSFDARLKIVRKILAGLKKSPSVQVSSWLIRAFYVWGGIDFVVKMLEKASSKCVALFSNLKGPVFPLPVGTDGLMWRLCCVTNPSFVPLSCGIVSFAGNMNVSLASDVNTMTSKQSQEIVDAIANEAVQLFKNLPDENYRWF